ncbi:MAG: transposase [Thermodesulfobacteriota bacterium]
MARPLRIEYPRAVYFITTIGNAGQNVFSDSRDAEIWLEVFENVCDRFGWDCYAYCLMGNYYMIAVETPEPNLSRGMRQLNGVYTQNYNRKHNKGGHVFQGRYKSILVQKDKYLAELIKYILFRPVISGFVKFPYQFKWSNCKYILDKEKCPGWVNKDYIKNLYVDVESEFTDYNDSNENILENIKKQIYLGDDEFISELQKYVDKEKDLREIPKVQRAKPINEYLNSCKSKEEAIGKAYLSGDFTLQQLADHFSLHYSTISRIVKDYESNAKV